MPIAANSISIIIPVLNEAANINRLLAHLIEKETGELHFRNNRCRRQ